MLNVPNSIADYLVCLLGSLLLAVLLRFAYNVKSDCLFLLQETGLMYGNKNKTNKQVE